MRILVLGAGATGGFFGARLIETGADVSFLVRPARAARLAAAGLRVVRRNGEWTHPVRALSAVDDHYDLIVLSCKAYDLDAAIEAIRPALAPRTRVLPLLNGLRHLDRLDQAIGAGHVLGGLCHISVALQNDGSIIQFGTLERLTFGSRDALAPVPSALRECLLALGPQCVESADILGAMWDKFAFIATLAGMTCLMRGSVGEIVAHADGADLMRRLHAECAQIAACSGHPLPAAALAAADSILTTPGSPLKASMLRDLLQGARTEGEHILGDLRARAQALALDTPMLAAALTHLRVHERTHGS